MSLIHPAISLSGYYGISNSSDSPRGVEFECPTHQAHQCVIIVFLLAGPIMVLLGASHAHSIVVSHGLAIPGGQYTPERRKY
jgi:hypothetical protein